MRTRLAIFAPESSEKRQRTMSAKTVQLLVDGVRQGKSRYCSTVLTPIAHLTHASTNGEVEDDAHP